MKAKALLLIVLIPFAGIFNHPRTYVHSPIAIADGPGPIPPDPNPILPPILPGGSVLA